MSKGDRKNLTVMMIEATYGVAIVELQDTPKMNALSWWGTQIGGPTPRREEHR